MDRESLIAAMDAGATPKFLPFWGHTQRGRTLGRECLSQWYPHPFEVDGQRYATAEHFMMAAKARLFGDAEAERAILGVDNPGKAKAIGRRVRGFDEVTWHTHRVDIVTRGSTAKFGERPLREILLATGDLVLVEAAPRDRIWGIGLGPNNPKVHDPRHWRGRNLLGFALMAARDTVKRRL